MDFSQYQKIIDNYDLEKTLFYKFCQNADKQEFLQFQLPFYKAVEAFPRMLACLAMNITDSKTRLHVIENLWEEHGHGKQEKFHTNTFKNYLLSLGEFDCIPYNLFVDNWITKCLSLKIDAHEYAAYLAAIEFIYTRVSKVITDKINKFNVVQEHYTLHEKLDFTHATELLETAYNIKKQDYSYIFSKAVEEFMDMLNQLTFLTHKDVLSIASEKIAFYYSREDSSIELKYACEAQSILCIGSGGEHIIHLKHKYPHLKIVCLDINPYQIELIKSKIKNINEQSLQCVLSQGKFEKLFEFFSQKISQTDIYDIKLNQPYAVEKLRIICQDIFSRINLNIIFTQEATRYTQKDFSSHFFDTLKHSIEHMDYSNSNIFNILNLGLPCIYPKKIIDDIEYWSGDFTSYFANNDEKFDMISISNIGDWMPLTQYSNLLNKLSNHLHKNGKIITRKLLGDYCLKGMIESSFSFVAVELDNTGFYSECVIGIK